MEANHKAAMSCINIHRGPLTTLGWGKMIPRGSRQAMGGKKGDTLAPFDKMYDPSDELAAIAHIFGYGFVSCNIHFLSRVAQTFQDNITLVETIRRWYPTGIREMEDISTQSELYTLGNLGTTLFYCSAFMAPQHTDYDSTLSLTVQLKKVAGDDEFNFAYTQWGVYLRTQDNTAW